ERLRLETGWRFCRVAPDQVDDSLAYIPWPALGEAQDGKDADARPEQVRHESSDTGLRPWILPSANPFLRDPATHAVCPEQAPPVVPDSAAPDLDDSAWQQVTVPHDWAIAGPFLVDGPHGGMGRLESWGVGWYRRELDIPEEDAGRSVHLEVDGAMSYASVWLNGVLVGGWPYGYNSWRVDLTEHVVPGGENVLAIRLDNPPRSARWYPGGGLFRDVWLVRTSPVAIAHWGTRITTPEVSEDSALVEVGVEVVSAAELAAEVVVSTELVPLAEDGEPLGEPVARTTPVALAIAPGAAERAVASARIERPALWGPPPTQRPHRYLAITTLRRGEEIVDRCETPFGVRRIEFD